MQGFHDRNDIEKEIEETEKYIEMFKVIKEGYEKKLERLLRDNSKNTKSRDRRES